MTNTKLPITIISGFAGAGKTTLVNQLIKQGNNLTIQVIDQTITGDKLFEEIKKISEKGTFEHLIIKLNKISEPEAIAELFQFEDEESGIDLSEITQIDNMVTVLDSSVFIKDFYSDDSLLDRGLGLSPEDDRGISTILSDQIEFANTIILNKWNETSHEEQVYLRSIIHGLNPEAQVIETDHCEVQNSDIFGVSLFDSEKTAMNAGRIKGLQGTQTSSEDNDFGVTSFVYRRFKPFDRVKFDDIVSQDWKGVIRSKGIIWTSDGYFEALERSQTGRMVNLGTAGRWLFSHLPEEIVEMSLSNPDIAHDVSEFKSNEHGDRRTEIVIIGIDINREELEKMLDSCLMTDEEMAQTDWVKIAREIEHHECGEDCDHDHGHHHSGGHECCGGNGNCRNKENCCGGHCGHHH